MIKRKTTADQDQGWNPYPPLLRANERLTKEYMDLAEMWVSELDKTTQQQWEMDETVKELELITIAHRALQAIQIEVKKGQPVEQARKAGDKEFFRALDMIKERSKRIAQSRPSSPDQASQLPSEPTNKTGGYTD